MSRKHGGRQYKSEEERRLAAIHASYAARRGRGGGRRAQRPRSTTERERIRSLLNIHDPRKRAQSEAVRMPFNPGTGRFEPKSRPTKTKDYRFKTKMRLLGRAERFFGWQERKKKREEIRALQEKERVQRLKSLRRGPLRGKVPSGQDLKALTEETKQAYEKVLRGPKLLPSERRYFDLLQQRPRRTASEILYGRKEEPSPIPTRTLFGHERIAAEDIARERGWAISKPVLLFERGLKGGTAQSIYDPERMVYPVRGVGSGAVLQRVPGEPRRQVVTNLPLHLRGKVKTDKDYSMEEWNRIIEARRKMGAFPVDEFGRRIDPMEAKVKRGGWTSRFTTEAETPWEQFWREARARRKDESEEAFERRRRHSYLVLLGKSHESPVPGVTKPQLDLYFNQRSTLDPYERVRIRNALLQHDQRRKLYAKELHQRLKDVARSGLRRRRARKRLEQFQLTMRAEESKRYLAQQKAKKERRQRWRKSLSKLTSRIFGR